MRDRGNSDAPKPQGTRSSARVAAQVPKSPVVKPAKPTVARKIKQRVSASVKSASPAKEKSDSDEESAEESVVGDAIPAYRKLKQNLYRSPLQRPAFDSVDDADVCLCDPRKDRCGIDCQNRQLYIECVPEMCKCTVFSPSGTVQEYCQNTAIQRQRFPRTEVFRTSSCGHGLRLCEDVPAHTILCEYLGEVLTLAEGLQRMSQYEKDDDFYFAALGDGLLLDARFMGSAARFANHSCEPNSVMQRWLVHGESRIVLVSLKPISAGEEITYDYHFHDDGFSANPINAQVCHCQSQFCAGTVGGNRQAQQQMQTQLTTRGEALLARKEGERAPTMESVQSFLESVRKYALSSAAEQQPQQQQQGDSAENLKADGKSDTSKDEPSDVDQMSGEVAEEQSTRIKTRSRERRESDTNINNKNSNNTNNNINSNNNDEWLSLLRHEPLRRTASLLQARLCEQRLWESECRSFLHMARGNALVDRTHAEGLLARCLVSRSPGERSLRTLLQEHNALQQSIDKWRSLYNAEKESNNSAADGETERHAHISWDEFCDLVRRVHNTLPLRVEGADWLLSLCAPLLQWTRKWVAPLQPRKMTTSKDKLLPTLQRLYSLCVSDPHSLTTASSSSSSSSSILNTQTKRERERETERDGRAWESLFAANDFLDEILSAYLEHRDLSSFSSSSGSRKKTKNEEAEQPQQKVEQKAPMVEDSPKETEREKRVVKRERGADAEVVCFCQLCEDAALHRVLTQCAQCSQWFHLPCTNTRPLSLSRLHREDALFLCSVCLFNRGMLSGFAFKPCTEWTFENDEKEKDKQREKEKEKGQSNKDEKQGKNNSNNTKKKKASEETLYDDHKKNSNSTDGNKRKRRKSEKMALSDAQETETHGEEERGREEMKSNSTDMDCSAVKIASHTERKRPRVEKEDIHQNDHDVDAVNAPVKQGIAIGERVSLSPSAPAAARSDSSSSSVADDAAVITTDVPSQTKAAVTTDPSFLSETIAQPVSVCVSTHPLTLSLRALSTAPPPTHKNTLTLEEVQHALIEAEALPIRWFPSLSLLRLLRERLSLWQKRVDNFLWVAQTSVGSPFLVPLMQGTAPSLVARVSAEKLLREALCLYFETQVLRVKAVRSLQLLREWIWAISCSPLLLNAASPSLTHTATEATTSTDTHNGEDEGKENNAHVNDDINNDINESNANNTSDNNVAKIALSAFEEVCAAGKIIVRTDPLLLSLTRHLDATKKQCHAIAQASLQCKDPSTALSLLASLRALPFDVQDEFFFAKLRCLTRPRQVCRILREREQHTHATATAAAAAVADSVLTPSPPSTFDSALNTIAAGEEDDGVYCLCRGHDDGSTMICCDGCEDWFHAHCVGLSTGRQGSVSSASTTPLIANDYKKKKKKRKGANVQEISAEDARFLCISCCMLQNVDFPHRW